jgi:hypothetical protein
MYVYTHTKICMSKREDRDGIWDRNKNNEIISWTYTMRQNKNEDRKVQFSEFCCIENQTINGILLKYRWNVLVLITESYFRRTESEYENNKVINMHN